MTGDYAYRDLDDRFGGERCPQCGQPSASYPAEIYCVECATEGWERDAERWKAHRRNTSRGAKRERVIVFLSRVLYYWPKKRGW